MVAPPGDRGVSTAAPVVIAGGGIEKALGEGSVCVDRGKLVRALADTLRPGTVRTGCAVVGFEQGAESVVVHVQGTARWRRTGTWRRRRRSVPTASTPR